MQTNERSQACQTTEKWQMSIWLGAIDGVLLEIFVLRFSNGLTAGVNVSYDEAFDTRVSADLKVRFGGASTTAQRKAVQQLPVINALTSTPATRDVRVHDKEGDWCCKGWYWCICG